MIKLCEMFTLTRLPLQSDARFSSYSGQKVNFYTFMSIILGVTFGQVANRVGKYFITKGSCDQRSGKVNYGPVNSFLGDL